MGGFASFSDLAKAIPNVPFGTEFTPTPGLREWFPDNYLACLVPGVVDQLDLSEFGCVYEEEDRGQPPYHPPMMTKILPFKC